MKLTLGLDRCYSRDETDDAVLSDVTEWSGTRACSWEEVVEQMTNVETASKHIKLNQVQNEWSHNYCLFYAVFLYDAYLCK